MEKQKLNHVTYKATLKLIDVDKFDNLKLENIDLKPRIEELKKDKHFFYKVLYYDRYKFLNFLKPFRYKYQLTNLSQPAQKGF